MSKPDGGPAFPSHECHEVLRDNGWRDEWLAVGGMSLRDYFAGQALAAVIDVYRFDNGGGIGSEHLPRNVAAHAYRLADAMLAERIKESQ